MGDLSLIEWNWKQADWPNFQFDQKRLEASEATFLRQGGMLLGAFKHLSPAEGSEFMAEAATSEAMQTSAIEGEILDRQSVRSSILRQLGIQTDPRRTGPREEGVAQMMVDLLQKGAQQLSRQTLWDWHRMLMQGRAELSEAGTYRTYADPMLIVSGPIGRESVHFEAPPSERVPLEMKRFVEWFNRTEGKMPTLARSGIAHLYFESIHPFEDGNGRIGRAISEKALAQGLGQPSLAMLSTEVESRQRDYYMRLERASRDLEITAWLEWFADVVLAAQRRTQSWVDSLITKTRLLNQLRGTINERQEKVLLRIFREGPTGFACGLSAGKYQTIAGASPATAGRDLAELVALGALTKTGVGKGTRYWLALR